MILFLAALFALPQKYEIVCDTSKTLVMVEKVEFQDYAPLKGIADALGLNYIFNNQTQRLYLTDGVHDVTMIPDINIVKCDSVYRGLLFPPRYLSGDVFFPVDGIIPLLAATFGKLIFIKKLDEIPLIQNITLATRGDSTVISYEWENPVNFDVQFTPQKTIIEIDGQYKQKPDLRPAGAVKSIKLQAYNTYTQIELALDKINSCLEREREVVFFNKITTAIRTIVLDPGHGGIDPGAVGKKGVYEKDVTTNITKYLKKMIEDSIGIDVLTTREEDIYLSLKGRTSFANNHSADLFISIHCNAAPKSRKSKGFETYFLSEARTTEERAAAALENASLKFDGIEPTDIVSKILYDLAQSTFLEESNTLAEFVQVSAENCLNIPSRGVNQAAFYVLRGAFMPAILVETAFLSNLEEEALLKTKEFQKELAACIFKGIREFVSDYERRMNK